MKISMGMWIFVATFSLHYFTFQALFSFHLELYLDTCLSYYNNLIDTYGSLFDKKEQPLLVNISDPGNVKGQLLHYY